MEKKPKKIKKLTEKKETEKTRRDFRRINYKLATSRLLHVVMDVYGGPVEMAKASKVAYQKLVNWRSQGHVPLHHAGRLSRLLKLNPAILNYEQVVEFSGEGKEFKEMTTDYLKSKGYNHDEVSWVLKGRSPKPVKELIA